MRWWWGRQRTLNHREVERWRRRRPLMRRILRRRTLGRRKGMEKA